MENRFPASFQLHDGTQVQVYQADTGVYEFYLTRLNSEKHNFLWLEDSNEIQESYETRFDKLQEEAVKLFKESKKESNQLP